MKAKTKGYLIVASRTKKFYNMAINLGESILDYYPEAKITLVTEERFLDGREQQFDNLLLCDDHYRAKLWGMARTPYDITFYIDADAECTHEDIEHVFDELGDRDMLFTPISGVNDYGFVFRYFTDKHKKDQNEYYSFKHNGGVCLYDSSNPKVMQFMHEWQQKYYAQRENYSWWPINKNGEKDFENFPQEMRFWDQFTLWWLIHESEDYKDLKIEFFNDWARWNYYNLYDSRTPIEKPPIIRHFSSGVNKEDLRSDPTIDGLIA